MFRYFHASEFTCHCGCGANLMEPTYIHKLDELRDRCGFPLIVTSGYRCPDHNAKVSSTGRSGPHTSGRAADVQADRQRAYELLRLALEMGFAGIGIKQHGSSRFIHLDDLTDGVRPTIWTYP